MVWTAESDIVSVPSRTLASILKEYKVEAIDFLSIDIEGAEFNALSDFDFQQYQPHVIVAEYASRELVPGSGDRIVKDYRVMELLLATGLYAVVHQTTANLIYLRR